MKKLLAIILVIGLAAAGGYFYQQSLKPVCFGLPELKVAIGKEGYTTYQDHNLWFSPAPNSTAYYFPSPNMQPLAEMDEYDGCYLFPEGQALVFANPNIYSMQNLKLPNIPYQLVAVFHNSLLGEDREAVLDILQKVPADIFSPLSFEPYSQYVFVLITSDHILYNPANLPLTPDEGPLLVVIAKDPKEPKTLERLIASFKAMHQKRQTFKIEEN